MKTVTTIQSVNPHSGPNHLRGLVPIFIGAIALIVAVGAVVTAVRAGGQPAALAAPVYGHALEMQYAQPWLQVHTPEAVRVKNHDLEWLYAQPWMNVDPGKPAARNKELEWLYAQPWMNVDPGTPAVQNKDLQWLYEQPWMKVDPD